jgi:hypothetical protein
MPSPLKAYQHTAQAKRLRRVAEQADAETHEKLIALAQEHEAKAIELDEKSEAARPPQRPDPGEAGS